MIGENNRVMQANFLIQHGVLSLNSACMLESTDGENSDRVCFHSKEIKVLTHRLYLRLLNIQKSSHELIQFFRKGNFKAGNRSFDAMFEPSRLHLVEDKEDVYVQMTHSLFLADNLPYLKVQRFTIEDKEGILLIDE